MLHAHAFSFWFCAPRSAEQALKYGLIDKIIAVNEKKRDDYSNSVGLK
jgi:hypothetical protein